MIEKALLAVIGLAAIWALTLLCVCAAGFALFAGLAAPLGPAWAAALVALVAGLLLAVVVLASRGKPAAHAPPMEEESLSARAFDLARRYPVAAGADGHARGGQGALADIVDHVALGFFKLFAGCVGVGARLGAHLLDAFLDRTLEVLGRVTEGALRVLRQEVRRIVCGGGGSLGFARGLISGVRHVGSPEVRGPGARAAPGYA